MFKRGILSLSLTVMIPSSYSYIFGDSWVQSSIRIMLEHDRNSESFFVDKSLSVWELIARIFDHLP